MGSEFDKRSQSIIEIGELIKVFIGDVLLAAIYVGPFNKKLREIIMNENFVPTLTKMEF